MKALIATLLIALSLSSGSAQAFDLKGKAKEFSDELKTKLHEVEDRLTRDSRAFVDELNRQWREEDQRIANEVTQSDDWKKAKLAAKKEKRELNKDFRQRAKVRGEELELEVARFAQEREKEAQALFAEMQKEVEEFKKSKQYSQARRDLGESKREITEIIRKWKQKLRDLRPRNLKFE